MKKSELRQLIKEEIESTFQDRMRVGREKAKKERGFMMLMNKWIYDNEPSSVEWRFNPLNNSEVEFFKFGSRYPYKTIYLQDVIEAYPDIVLKYNLK